MAGLPKDHPQDGRKYHVGEYVDFTDDNGKVVPGVVHAVRYQVGRYELVGEHHEDMFDKTSRVVPGTGRLELIAGTENERHSFEYIMVHKSEHKAWNETEASNQEKIKRNAERTKRNDALITEHRGSVKPELPDHPDNFKDMPELEGHESLEQHPPLTQHIRVFEEDEVDKPQSES